MGHFFILTVRLDQSATVKIIINKAEIVRNCVDLSAAAKMEINEQKWREPKQLIHPNLNGQKAPTSDLNKFET